MVHLNSEDFADAWVGGGVCGEEDHLLSRLHNTLLDAAGKHISDALDLVDAGDRHPHGGADGALRHAAHLVQHVVDGVDMDGLGAHLNVDALPPAHVLACKVQR